MVFCYGILSKLALSACVKGLFEHTVYPHTPTSHAGSDVPRVTQQEARGQDSTQVSLAVQGVLLGLLAGVAAPVG